MGECMTPHERQQTIDRHRATLLEADLGCKDILDAAEALLELGQAAEAEVILDMRHAEMIDGDRKYKPNRYSGHVWQRCPHACRDD